MMKPKEEAKELVDRFFTDGDKGLKKVETHINYECAKQCALICVDECIKAVDECVDYPYYSDLHYTDWKEVKQEIEKL